MTQESDSGGTTIFDARNRFNELIRIAILRNVRHLWTVGARFAFN